MCQGRVVVFHSKEIKVCRRFLNLIKIRCRVRLGLCLCWVLVVFFSQMSATLHLTNSHWLSRSTLAHRPEQPTNQRAPFNQCYSGQPVYVICKHGKWVAFLRPRQYEWSGSMHSLLNGKLQLETKWPGLKDMIDRVIWHDWSNNRIV